MGADTLPSAKQPLNFDADKFTWFDKLSFSWMNK